MNQSVDFYRKLVEEFEEMQHLHMLAHLENELGLYYNKLGNIKKALATYENSIRHYEKLNELNDDKFIHDLSITLSNIALEYSKFDKMAAKEYYERCIELRKRVLEKDEDYRPTYEKALASMQKLGV
jgi:tetratricopeptide (TPR) repeat protein